MLVKVPTCCSCHIDGYQEEFPPHSQSHSYSSGIGGVDTVGGVHDFNDNFQYTQSSKTKYSTIFEDDDDIDDYDSIAKGSIAQQYSNGFRKSPSNPYASSTFSYADVKIGHHVPEITKKVRKPSNGGNIIDTYLTPPTGSEFEGDGSFQRRIRRPQRKHIRDRDQPSNAYHQNVAQPPQSSPYLEHQSKRRVSISSSSPNDRKPPMINVNIPLPSISSASTSAQDLGKRVNYNYHPIIDFFSESVPSTRMKKYEN